MRHSYAVITATLNAGEHVGRAIDSVLSQSVLPAEYIVIDGGSADETLREVEFRADRTRRLGLPVSFRVMQQSSRNGIAGAWNEAIAHVTSDVIFLLNADDWLEPQMSRSVIKAFDDHADAGVVHAKARFLREDGTSLGICAPTWINRVGLQCRSVHCATFVRRDVYRTVGGFDERYRTTLDFDFLERCWKAGVCFRYLEEVVTNFQLGGVSNSLRDRADLETLRIGLRHSRTKVPPIVAFLARRLFMRPLGLAGFDLRLRPEESRKESRQEREIAEPSTQSANKVAAMPPVR
ncbi:MAG: glycosyltransferase [Phycisphaerae bacterium]|nr:glycosyltransferase [Phycisphaerae bacterium]